MDLAPFLLVGQANTANTCQYIPIHQTPSFQLPSTPFSACTEPTQLDHRRAIGFMRTSSHSLSDLLAEMQVGLPQLRRKNTTGCFGFEKSQCQVLESENA